MMQLEPPHPAGQARPQSGTEHAAASVEGGEGQTVGSPLPLQLAMPASYQKFTSQMELGKYLTAQYHIRDAGTNSRAARRATDEDDRHTKRLGLEQSRRWLRQKHR